MGRDEGTGGAQPSMEKQIGGISAEIKKLEKELPEIEKGVKQLEEVVKDYTLKLEDEDCSFDEGIQQINESIEELDSNIDALKDILNNPDVDEETKNQYREQLEQVLKAKEQNKSIAYPQLIRMPKEETSYLCMVQRFLKMKIPLKR
jgi:septal ring factor EnvC (AmiA/AmiB activator)